MEYFMNIHIFIYTLVSAQAGDCLISQFLDSVPGEIYGGNFSYFSIREHGILSLELISHLGDCDLYVSQFETKPTFELDSYCLESSSCGLDRVVVPKRFKRPLAIGIYGHPSHEVSTYTLNIYQIRQNDADNESDDLDVVIENGYVESYLEESKSTHSYLYHFISLIFNLFKYIWDFLVSMDRSNEVQPLISLLDIFV